MVAAAHRSLLVSIAKKVADYRQHEFAPPTMNAAHVGRWVDQFDPAVHGPLLTELDAVLGNTYVSRADVLKFLGALCRNTKLAGTNPAAFWPKVNFLDVQKGGQSQTEMLALFGECLDAAYGINIAQCGSKDGPYVYLDDVMFSGNRVLNDLRSFAVMAPASVKLHVIVIAYHSSGQWYASDRLEKAFQDAGKKLDLAFWRAAEFENRKDNQDCDVLRPTHLPSDKAMQAYVASMGKYSPLLRSGTHLGSRGTFATVAGRELLEQEFLKAGLRIRGMCGNLKANHRPLGYTPLIGLGFGSTIVTFRNCPNSCPLALWVGDPWYPLFPRKNN